MRLVAAKYSSIFFLHPNHQVSHRTIVIKHVHNYIPILSNLLGMNNTPLFYEQLLLFGFSLHVIGILLRNDRTDSGLDQK